MSSARLKWTLTLLLCAALLVVIFWTYRFNALVYSPMLTQGQKPVVIEIKSNSTAYSLSDNLAALHLISSKKALLALIRMQGYTKKLKTGVYQVLPGETARQFIDKVVRGEVLVLPFRIIEGTTLKQVKRNLENAPYLKYSEDVFKPFIEDYPNVEGLFLADTYLYGAGDNARAILLMANKALRTTLDEAWNTRSADLPYKSAYEMLIAASILEKETALPSERKLIAGVIANRLKRRMPLQMDPTVIYALGDEFVSPLAHDDLAVESPYNTYKHRGLPPTPIAMVGKEAIEAAAHPTPSRYLYFMSRGDGSHEFSETYEAQKRAVQRYKYNNKGD